MSLSILDIAFQSVTTLYVTNFSPYVEELITILMIVLFVVPLVFAMMLISCCLEEIFEVFRQILIYFFINEGTVIV